MNRLSVKMANCARIRFSTDYSVATSGIAGPDGGSIAKPVGTVWIAVSSAKGTSIAKYIYGNDRSVNIKRFSIAALDVLRRQIINE